MRNLGRRRSGVRNANPGSLVSWADFLMVTTLDGALRPFAHVPAGHNSSYKRDPLLALGGRPSDVEPETVLHSIGPPRNAPAHRTGSPRRHVNYSLWVLAALQFLWGRLFAA